MGETDLTAPALPGDDGPRLGLAYDRAIAPAKLAAMERLGKRQGLPLGELEALGQDEARCDAFLAAARSDPSPVPEVRLLLRTRR